MSHETSIGELKDELAAIQQRATDYFQPEAVLAKSKDAYEMFIFGKDYWSHIAF